MLCADAAGQTVGFRSVRFPDQPVPAFVWPNESGKHSKSRPMAILRNAMQLLIILRRHVVDNSAGVGITMSLCAGGLVDVDAVG